MKTGGVIGKCEDLAAKLEVGDRSVDTASIIEKPLCNYLLASILGKSDNDFFRAVAHRLASKAA